MVWDISAFFWRVYAQISWMVGTFRISSHWMDLHNGNADTGCNLKPVTKRVQRHSWRCAIWLFKCESCHVGYFPIKPGGRVLEFIYGSKESFTKTGLVASTTTTNIHHSEYFKEEHPDLGMHPRFWVWFSAIHVLPYFMWASLFKWSTIYVINFFIQYCRSFSDLWASLATAM